MFLFPVGLKLGSVDPERSIDLKYLGVQLPLNFSEGYECGASSTTSQGEYILKYYRTVRTVGF